MNEVGGVEKFQVWVEHSNNPTFKMRKMGLCEFHDLILSQWCHCDSLRSHLKLGSAKPTKGFILLSVLSSPVGCYSKIVQGQVISRLAVKPRPMTISPTHLPICFHVTINKTQEISWQANLI